MGSTPQSRPGPRSRAGRFRLRFGVSLAAALLAAGCQSQERTDLHEGRRPNRLAHEKSPYLLQHAHNPVDWYPWGDEAFEQGAPRGQADLPLDRLLDLPLVPRHGARVVRERGASRALLNQCFVPIKVDREERPDVDRVYMTAMQAMGIGRRLAAQRRSSRPTSSRSSAAPTSRPTRARRAAGHDRAAAAASTRRGASSARRSSTRRARWSRARRARGCGRAGLRARRARDVLFDRALRAARAHRTTRAHGGFGGAPKFPVDLEPQLPAALRGRAIPTCAAPR